MAEKFSPELSPEMKEKEPEQRLETIVYFIRHGSAESLSGADKDPEIDRQKHLSPEGIKQAEKTGEKIAQELQFLESGDNIFLRSSPYPRAKETVGIVRDKVIGSLEKQNKKIISPISVKPERDELRFSLDNFDAYSVGEERRGSTKGLPEEWVRYPEILQQDLEKAGVTGKNAQEILTERTINFQKIAGVWEKAGRLLRTRWERIVSDQVTDLSEIRPPRLVVLNGSHGGIVPEAWLYEAIKEYESKTGEKIPPELTYGEYFKVHFSINPKEAPILTLHGKEIPLNPELFQKS